MKVFSKNHSLAASATAAVEVPKGTNGKPLSSTMLVQHPAGTILDLDDDTANDLIRRNLATEYVEAEHASTNGVVHVSKAQMLAPPLPEGFTHPVVVRQDETFNDGSDGTPAQASDAPVILRDTKGDAAKVKADEDAAKAAGAATAAASSNGRGAP